MPLEINVVFMLKLVCKQIIMVPFSELTLFFTRTVCNESCTVAPRTFMNEVNEVHFDFMLCSQIQRSQLLSGCTGVFSCCF